MDDASNNAEPATGLENSPIARRRIFWVGLVTVWLFAAGFLQFGLIDRFAPPASQRVNNGDHATFFAVHINPYFVFSEDFHLYIVRAKRILERGWTDSPLRATADSRANYSSPLQAALMMLAVQTDGRPVPYSLFIACVFAVAWGVLYVAATRWLPSSVSPLTPLIAVLVTVLFESVDGLTHLNTDFGQWPVHRGLRMATLAWTNPLSLSALLASVSLIMQPARPAVRLLFVGIVLSMLAAADNWAFLLTSGCCGIAAAIIAVAALLERQEVPSEFRARIASVVGMGLAAIIALAIHQATSDGITGDVLMRAGFGPEWRDSPFGATGGRSVPRHLRGLALLLAAFAIIASIYVRFTSSSSRRTVGVQTTLDWPAGSRLYFLALAGIPVASAIATVGTLAIFGMDEYHAFQFFWRSDFMLLFALVVIVSEAGKHLVRWLVSRSNRATWIELSLTSAFLLAFFAYHNSRIHEFAARTAAREFFLTKDEEQLRDWLREREPTLGNYSLATASHELNYLCAYWTNADLLLPEGFPLHSAATNDEIEKQTAELLSIYGSTPQAWRDFNLHRHVWDQWSWGRSRLLSARHGYMYYLLHRALLAKGREPEVKQNLPRATTPFIADLNLRDEATLRASFHQRFLAGVESAERVAGYLEASATLAEAARPEVILIDEVSRALGTPNLDGYTREFQHGSLEAWVKSDR